jgi:RecA-family ATPase
MEYNQQIDEQLYQRAYLNNYQPSADVCVMKIGGKVIGSLQNIVCFSGLPKAGKSTFLNGCIAAAYLPYSVFTMSMHMPEGRKTVCYIDTESSEYDFYRSIDRIKTMAEYQAMPHEFTAYRFRDLAPKAIIEYTEYILFKRPDCSVMVIDGLLDCLMNYNDEVESRHLINWLKRITTQYNVLLIGVVHTGKKDGMTLGHFGSMIDRYCQSVLTVEKDSKTATFELKAKFLRSDIPFDPVVIQNDMGVFRQVN